MEFISLVAIIAVALFGLGFVISLLPVSMQSDRALERLRVMHLKNKNYDKYKKYSQEIDRRWQERQQRNVVDNVVTPELVKQANEMGQKTQELLEETMRVQGVSMEQAHDILSQRLRDIEAKFRAQGMDSDAASEKALIELYGLNR